MLFNNQPVSLKIQLETFFASSIQDHFRITWFSNFFSNLHIKLKCRYYSDAVLLDFVKRHVGFLFPFKRIFNGRYAQLVVVQFYLRWYKRHK